MDTYDARPPLSAKSPRSAERATGGPRRRLTYFLPAFDVGAIVKKNAVIGRVMDAHGEIVEEIRSPVGPAYLAALGKPYAPIHSGAMVAECIGVE